MVIGIGALGKAGARIESDQGMTTGDYPTTEATADSEEVKVKTYDQIPLLAESLDDGHQWENDETIVGVSSIPSSERVAREPSGGHTLQGTYDGLDVFFACALGGEDHSSPDWTVGTQKTEVNCTINAAKLVGTMNALNIEESDDDRFIKFDTSGTDDTDEGQVRHISQVDADVAESVTWLTAVTAGNHANAGIVIADEFKHTFEPTNNLHDQLWTDVYSDYPTAGIGAATDKLLRRFTLCIAKDVSLWAYRSVFINSMTISGSAKAGITIELDLLPFDRVTDSLSSSRQDGSTVAGWKTNLKWTKVTYSVTTGYGIAVNERIMFSDLTFRIDDYSTSTPLAAADNLGISEFSLTVNNNLKGDDHDSVGGVYRAEPARNTTREITGTFTVPRYTSDARFTLRDAATMQMAHFNFVGSTMSTIARAFQIWLPSLKITNIATSMGGSGLINETVSFQCFTPAGQASSFPTYGVSLPYPDIQIQTTNHNPFSMFRDQCAEY